MVFARCYNLSYGLTMDSIDVVSLADSMASSSHFNVAFLIISCKVSFGSFHV